MERRNALSDEELSELTRQEWHAIFDAIQDAIWLLDTDQRIFYSNKAAQELFHLSAAEMSGRHCWTIVHGTTKPIPECPVMRAKKSLRRETGEICEGDRVFELSVDPLYKDGALHGFVHALRDITKHKQAEASRLQFERQIQQLQKFESLSLMAGGIAHDFNNLLTVILGNAGIALEKVSSHSPIYERLQAIEDASHRAAALCNQMLTYSGKSHFIISTTDLNNIVQGTIAALKTTTPPQIQVDLHLDEHLPPLLADPMQLRQVVISLFHNAVEAIADRPGRITLTTGLAECRNDTPSDPFADEGLPDGWYVWLSVADTGCGMTPEIQNRIFEPFFSTKFTGRGLGLPAVMGIVQGHHGRLFFESSPGNGSTFRVVLPAAMPPATKPVQPETKSDDNWTGKGTILVAEDDPGIRDLVQHLLEKLGFTVLTAGDGEQAVELYEKHPYIDLVLLNYSMPRMNGGETYAILRRLNPNVRVLLTSGHDETSVTARVTGPGILGFLPKPYTLSQLRTHLRTAFSKKS